MLKAYPDYGKSPPEYLAGMIQQFALYDREIQEGLADPVKGLRGRHAFLPAPAHVVALADELQAKREERRAFEERYKFKHVMQPHEYARGTFKPFPQLWEAFRDEPQLLFGRSFDTYQKAHKALFLAKPYGGKDVARQLIIDAGYNEFVKRFGVPREYEMATEYPQEQAA